MTLFGALNYALPQVEPPQHGSLGVSRKEEERFEHHQSSDSLTTCSLVSGFENPSLVIENCR